jgi:Ca2+-binding RTX toxin-like protein
VLTTTFHAISFSSFLPLVSSNFFVGIVFSFLLVTATIIIISQSQSQYQSQSQSQSTLSLPSSSVLLPSVFADAFDDAPEESVINCSPIGQCDGTSDRDIIIGTSASDLILGFEGNDLIEGGLLTDEIYGGEGDDTIQGGEGSDVIFGQDGDDFLYADSPNSAISLLINQQNLDFEDSLAEEFRLQDEVIRIIEEEGLLEILDDEIPFGSSKLFNILKNSTNELQNMNLGILIGGSGNDHLFGGSGNDILKGSAGIDFFDCNEGIDTVLDFNSKEDTVNLNCENI